MNAPLKKTKNAAAAVKKELCSIKTVTGKVILDADEKKRLREAYECALVPFRRLLRLILAGYEGLDDGIYDEVAAGKMSKGDFFAEAGRLREGILGGVSSRALKASMLGDREPTRSTMKARGPIGALRAAGVLPLKSHLSSSDDFNLIEQVVEMVRSWVRCDRLTRRQYAEQVSKIEGLEKELREGGESARGRLERARKRLDRMRPSSGLSMDDMDCTKYSCFLGANHVPFTISNDGRGLRLEILGAGSLMRGSYYVAYGAGKPRNLMHDCVVSPLGDTFRFDYMENGKRPRVGILKQPRLCWRRRGNDLSLYLHMAMNLSEQVDAMFAGDNPAFSRYWPKEVEGLDDVAGLTVLGVDVNIRRAAHCVAVTADRFDGGFPVGTRVDGEWFDELTDLGDDYRRLSFLASDLSWLIRKTNGYKDDPARNLIKPSEVEKFDSSPGAYERYMRAVDAMPDDKLAVWERARQAGYGKWVKELDAEFRSMKDDRAHGRVVPSLSDDLAWCDLIGRILSLKKTLHFRGYESKPRNDFCVRLKDERANVRNDVRKKLARYVLDAAADVGASVVAIENLSRMTGNKARKRARRENRVFALMAPRQLADTIRAMARAEGVAVVEVDSAYTSQWVRGEGVIGNRHAHGKWLYWRREDGVVDRVDADRNAATNIAERALFRHSEPYSIRFEKKGGVVEAKHVRYELPEPPVREPAEDDDAFKKRLAAHQRKVKEIEARSRRLRAVCRLLFDGKRPWDAFAGSIKEGSSKLLFRHRGGLVAKKQFDGLCEDDFLA